MERNSLFFFVCVTTRNSERCVCNDNGALNYVQAQSCAVVVTKFRNKTAEYLCMYVLWQTVFFIFGSPCACVRPFSARRED